MKISYADDEVPLLIMLGQSNTDGRGIKSDIPDLASTWFNYWFNDEVKIYQKPLKRNPICSTVNHRNDGAWENYTGNNGMIVSPQTGLVATSCGPELGTAFIWKKYYYPFIQKPLYIIKCAIGGTPLANDTIGVDTNWSEDPAQLWELASLYVIRPAITQLLCTGKKPRLIGVFWGQGESDATKSRAPLYENNLKNIFKNIREKSGFSSARIVVMGLSGYNFPPDAWLKVKNAQAKVVENDFNSVLIPTDGSDNSLADHRYLPGVQAGDLHYTAIGNFSIAKKAFRHYHLEGVCYDRCVNDFELITNDAILNYSSESFDKPQNKLIADSLFFQKKPTNSSVDFIENYSFSTFPSKTHCNDVVPSPEFLFRNFDNAKDQEIIFRIAHDGDVNTKPSIILRAKNSAADISDHDYSSGVVVQVIHGGREVTVGTYNNDICSFHESSPFLTSPHIKNEQLIWFRINLKGKTLIIDCFYEDMNLKLAYFPSEFEWLNICTITNDNFPESGQTWFTMLDSIISNHESHYEHFHIPVMIANKC